VAAFASASSDVTDAIVAEISSYLTANYSGTATATEFWKSHELSYPLLSKMAKVYLSLSPGSVPVESLFSTAGYVLNSKRSSLASYKAHMVCFVHDNYDVV